MSRYDKAHKDPQGPGDQRPTALNIIHDNALEGALTGKVAVVTGVSSGLGVEVVRALATTGIRLFLTARDVTKAKQALGDQLQDTKVELIKMDQTSMQSVREAAKVILSRTNAVNILINNAGIMAVPELELTADGYEVQFATNHLSHFLLFQLLKRALLAATSHDFQSRVVMVSASAHRIYSTHPDNYHFQNGGYHPWVAYAQSKCGNIYMANEIDRRYGHLGLHGISLHPGIIATDVGRFLSDETKEAMKQDKMLRKVLKTPEQGAATTVYAAVDKGLEGKGGKYLVNCTEATRGPDDGQSSSETYVSHTYCPQKEAELWKDSLEMVGLEDDE
ncbi:uncharacterized protein TRUGW13939_11944 [Talaromyces rugulosus]|uniref:Uncharacterized protein n=1 Tax=Talaromyces rugulosus TaxID=121627 RepID=A0A7H8RFE3_TALRU|nr:uncharacterized protein TRUGW13939_11944 [Talaromyces rugulosus]QKX64768.1 hypothetical protein TRUGW13939_11944 [Talaromyces rugulosus]